jgi:octaprenyl-diphosphate synthase
VNFVIRTVEENGGIEYAREKMIQYRDEALGILHGFAESPVRNALEELVRYTTDRKY